jgi:hypothetical protein
MVSIDMGTVLPAPSFGVRRTPMPQVAQTEDEKQDTVVQTKEKW